VNILEIAFTTLRQSFRNLFRRLDISSRSRSYNADSMSQRRGFYRFVDCSSESALLSKCGSTVRTIVPKAGQTQSPIRVSRLLKHKSYNNHRKRAGGRADRAVNDAALTEAAVLQLMRIKSSVSCLVC
jgi:hypothetical protein